MRANYSKTVLMQIEFVNMRFTNRELRELLLILKSVDEIQKRGD